jgi:branched-chain amino acid transport system ATP-binding protein
MRRASMHLLEVNNVTKRFGGVTALKNVSLYIDSGEKIAIIGPNGSGKTTLFNVINGVYIPEDGRIIYMGRDITKLSAHERAKLGIARAFQITRPFPGLSVRENVMIGALFGTLSEKINTREALKIADEMLKLVGLYNKRDELAIKLTGPERKLLELARALAMKPKILLLDEIVAGMPPAKVDEIVDLVKNVAERENIAVGVMVEHVIRAVIRFAERVYVLDRGEIVLSGKVEDVMRNPKLREIYLGARFKGGV